MFFLVIKLFMKRHLIQLINLHAQIFKHNYIFMFSIYIDNRVYLRMFRVNCKKEVNKVWLKNQLRVIRYDSSVIIALHHYRKAGLCRCH